MCGGPPASQRKITEVSGLALGSPASARTFIASARLSPPTPRVPIRRNERLESGSGHRLDFKVRSIEFNTLSVGYFVLQDCPGMSGFNELPVLLIGEHTIPN